MCVFISKKQNHKQNKTENTNQEKKLQPKNPQKQTSWEIKYLIKYRLFHFLFERKDIESQLGSALEIIKEKCCNGAQWFGPSMKKALGYLLPLKWEALRHDYKLNFSGLAK